MKVTVKIINAFSICNTGGNPAGVVLGADELSAAEKQTIAFRAGLSETAFVSASALADFKLDFFTPNKQIAHCGHATIATFTYLKQTGAIKKNNSSKETIDGTRKIYFEADNAFMEQKAPVFQQVNNFVKDILVSVSLDQSAITAGMEPVIVNTGNSFMIIPVKNEVILKQVKPNFEKIKLLSEQFGLIGYYVFTNTIEDNNFDATSRMFAPLYGINEEPATGMAAGPLACFLYENGIGKTSINIQQGKFMNKPSISQLKVNINVEQGVIKNLFAGGNAYPSNEIIVEI